MRLKHWITSAGLCGCLAVVVLGFMYAVAFVTLHMSALFSIETERFLKKVLNVPIELRNEFIRRQDISVAILPPSLMEQLRHDMFELKIPGMRVFKVFQGNGGTVEIIFNQLDAERETPHGRGFPLNLEAGEVVFHLSVREKYVLTRKRGENGTSIITKYGLVNGSLRNIWNVESTAHHTLRVGDEGEIYAPTFLYDEHQAKDSIHYRMMEVLRAQGVESYGHNQFRNEGAAVIDKQGKITHSSDFTELFYKNGLLGYVIGAGPLEADPFHTNSASPFISSTDPNTVFKPGDILVSLRHRSMVFVYRPSTQEVIWYRVGPWLGQHDAKFTRDGALLVFNNNVLSTANNRTLESAGFLYPKTGNDIIAYDFKTGEFISPYRDCFTDPRVHTTTGGYFHLLGDQLVIDFSAKGIFETCNLTTGEITYYGNVINGEIAKESYFLATTDELNP